MEQRRVFVRSRMRASNAGVSLLASCPACLLNNSGCRGHSGLFDFRIFWSAFHPRMS